MATHKACNTIPPVTAVDYKPKGTWETIGDLPSYTSGSSKPTNVLIVIYDIFGPAPQTLQGADLLAAALEPLNTLVVVPDFFKGEKAQAAWYAPDASEELKAKKAAFMAWAFEWERWGKVALQYVEEGKRKWGSEVAFGSLGLCWGGKLAAISSGQDTPWKVSGQVHPGGLKAEDAEKITIPHILLASNGEDATIVQKYKEILAKDKNSFVETYPTMHHGWMGARAKLSNEDNLKEFARGYNQSASFIAEHLQG